MPVLINQQTGTAEDLAPEVADKAVVDGTHTIPLNDPSGNPVAAPMGQAQQYLAQGYTQPSTDQLKSLLDYSKFSSNTEQAKTFLEGAGEGATFGLSTAAERAMGVKPEDIQARRETNPGVHQLGQAAGLTGSAFIPVVGEANLLTKAGTGVAKAVGLGEATGLLAQVGSAAVRGAVETGLYQSADEVSKLFAGDPNQSAQTAISEIGLAGLLGAGVGGAFGAVPPLWKASQETPLGKLLGNVKEKANGGTPNIIPASIDRAIEVSGLDLSPEMRGALSNDHELQSAFQLLQESQTQAGKTAQESFGKFKTQTQDVLARALGKTPEELASLPEVSAYEEGSKLQSSIIKEMKAKVDPLAEQFGQIKEKFKSAELAQTESAELANNLAEIGQKYGVSPSSAEFQKINTIIKELPNVKTLEDLRNFQSVHSGDIANKQLWSISSPIKNAFRDAEENIVMRNLGEEAPQLIEQHKQARAAYRAVMEDIDALNDRLHVGKYSGPDTFFHALKDMSPEDVLRRMTNKADVGLIDLAREKLPMSSQIIQDTHLNQLLKNATKYSKGEDLLTPNHLFKELDKLSPELKQFIMPNGGASLSKINAIRELIEAVPQKMNPSGTAKTIDALWGQLPGGAAALAGLLLGHNPATFYVLGQLAKLASREVPDAARLGLLKFLGSNKPVNSPAFKSMLDFTAAMIKGENTISRMTKAVFKSGIDVAPQVLWPTPKQRERLDQKLQSIQKDTAQLMDVGGQTGYYMEDHGAALATVAARASQYLNSLRPNTTPMAPLDAKMPASSAASAAYSRALDIANQPMIAVASIRSGTLTPQDVQTVRTIYPELYARVSQKLMDGVIEQTSKGKDIPYSTRLSLSLFLGQNLDSTMTPQAILAAQPKPMGQAQPAAPQGHQKGSMKALDEFGQSFQTIGQARAAERATRA